MRTPAPGSACAERQFGARLVRLLSSSSLAAQTEPPQDSSEQSSKTSGHQGSLEEEEEEAEPDRLECDRQRLVLERLLTPLGAVRAQSRPIDAQEDRCCE